MTTTTEATPEVFSVKVGKQPGMVTIKKVSNGSTAGDVLRLADLDPRDHELRINGVPANVGQVLKPNDAVLLFKPLAGNAGNDAISTVLEQVHRLQEQANLTDAERANRLALQGEVTRKQADLKSAIERLRASISVCAQTSARVGAVSEIGKSLATEMAALPADLQTQCGAVTEQLGVLSAKLTELAASCQADQAAARAEVESKAAALQNAKDALEADIAKHRVSPEEAVDSAEAALAEAERVAGQK
ncbi:MAG: hypothetical protein K2X77_33415 [Candidatus Obscuribacterales bacterium]|nr:hypothetical protein [Candidatus Obscuribacterales bacterium]